jgi:hypothetical protein
MTESLNLKNFIIVFESRPEITCSSLNLPVWWMKFIYTGAGKPREVVLLLNSMLINRGYKLFALTRHVSGKQCVSCDIIANRPML